jgi:hypothetical protein
MILATFTATPVLLVFALAAFAMIVSLYGRNRAYHGKIANAMRTLNQWSLHSMTFYGDYSPDELDIIRDCYETCKASSYGLLRLDNGVREWAERTLGLYSPSNGHA